MVLHVIKCHHPTIFNCTNEKLSKKYAFKPTFHKKGNIKVNIFVIVLGHPFTFIQ